MDTPEIRKVGETEEHKTIHESCRDTNTNTRRRMESKHRAGEALNQQFNLYIIYLQDAKNCL